jgi:hypothetical protein
MPGPISPEEAVKQHVIPEEVFEIVNRLLVERFAPGHTVHITQTEVLDGLRGLEKFAEINRQSMCDKGWLDFEAAYQNAGWLVSFDKPGYNESYEASWTFRKRRKND